ncbi:MAG: hypothetical protein CMK65_02200 [Pseudoalteromonas sp.]|uniref:dynamin family protein n=1 Tax=Pseudoalteromonas sp. TaxID=53249 RepID=UPI000C964B97|nr:dynamin family protein [Pseudoalteromonas sp.]MAD02426.1 hypothetical protein [Pseudoalteromonas sp.]|tara:strand:- start:8017 stop:9843 length:1827 start_codon:yes stop_codon:yes gene_type:complete
MDVENTCREIDEVSKFFKIKRKQLANNIKTSVEQAGKEFDALSQDHDSLKEQHDTLNVEHKDLMLKHDSQLREFANLSETHDFLKEQHDTLNVEHTDLTLKHDSQIKEFANLLKTHDFLKEQHDTLNVEHKDLTLKHDSQIKEFANLSREHDSLKSNHNEVTTKYDLVSRILASQRTVSEEMNEFNNIVNNDFVEFANAESSLAEEAKALLMMQSIQRELHLVSSFPKIYNKNIVAVGGGFSAGKSEFISSFFSEKKIKLPIGIKPVTAIPTYVTSGNKHAIKGYTHKGGAIDVSPELYANLSHDFIKSFDFNLKDIMPLMAMETKIEVFNHLCFVDTPGYNPTNTGTTETDHKVATEHLQKADVLLWLVGLDASDGAIPASDLAFLEELSLENRKLFIVANKADLKSPDDLEDVLDCFEDTLDEYGIEATGISAFSSISKKEISYRRESIFDFLNEKDRPVNVRNKIKNELNDIFNMYKDAISEQIEWTRGIQNDMRSLELDFMRDGMDIFESKRATQRLDKIRTLFSSSELEKQLKTLQDLKEKMDTALDNIFKLPDGVQNDMKSLELDFMQDGKDIHNSGRATQLSDILKKYRGLSSIWTQKKLT